MATKSGPQEPEKTEAVEELLDALDAALDRVRVHYEQYFLGIQKQPPTYLHTDVERKIRDLAQLQVRNTALRYRFAMLQQKFGSYHSYWRRTLRQIESGTYTRSLSKIGRQAARTGAAVPEEILAAMPKRMREQIKRDREAVLALAELRGRHAEEPELLTLADEEESTDMADPDSPAFIDESTELRRQVRAASAQIDEADADFDLDAFFAAVTNEGEPEASPQAAGVAPPTPPVAVPLSAPLGTVPPSTVPPSTVPNTAPPSSVPPSSVPPSTGQPSTGSGEPPRPPSVPSRVMTPPAGIATTRPSSPGPGSPPSQAVKPPAFKLPALAPSQATRPIPVLPGAAAARAPSAVETLAGPFPRLPSLPPLPSTFRAPGGAPAAPATPAPGAEPADSSVSASADARIIPAKPEP